MPNNSETYGSSQYIHPKLLSLVIRLFHEKPTQLWLADKHACPIPDKVALDYGVNGVMKAIERYNSCDIVTAKVWEIARRVNPNLFILLTTWRKRRFNEGVGKYEEPHVPKRHLTELSPLSSPVGYALARVIICIMNAFEKQNINPESVWGIVQHIVETSADPEELLARFSDYALRNGVPSLEILHHVLAQGVLDEEHTVADFYNLHLALWSHAETLMRGYETLNSEEKKAKGILIEIPRP